MYKFLITVIIAMLMIFTACRDRSRVLERDASNATIASETGTAIKGDTVPVDEIGVTKALISGVLYEEPDFESKQIIRFDTDQQLFLLDTTDIMFAKARLYKNATAYTGYISKAILPEKE